MLTWLTILRQRARAAPVITAFMILGLFGLTLLAPVILLGPVDVTGGSGSFDFDTLASGLSWQFLVTLAVIAIVVILRWWDITRLTSKIDRKGLRSFYAIMIYPVAGIITFTLLLLNSDTDRPAYEMLLIVLTLNLFVGLTEEILFRGFLFGALRQKMPLITAILLSSLCFGVVHIINASVGQSLPETAFQMLNATALGVLFCGLALQANSLWPAIILHMTWNAYAMMGIGVAEVVTAVPGGPVDAPALSLWSLILPALVSLIAWGVLYSYKRRTGTRLRDITPITD